MITRGCTSRSTSRVAQVRRASWTVILRTREGVWRNHRVLSTGNYRHSVYYSVIDSEWPTIRERLNGSEMPTQLH